MSNTVNAVGALIAAPSATAGAGAESRSPIGWVIVGGLLLGTLLTLFVIPVAYTLLTRDRSAAARPRNDELAHGFDEASSTPCRRRFIKPSNPA